MAARAIETADSELCQLQDCQSLMDFPLTLPIIPFTPNEALAPGCTKVLHLYEDKDLELLEAVMAGNVSQTVSDSCDDLQHDPFLEDPQGSHGSGEGSGPGRSRARVFVHSTIEMGSAHTPCVACASSSPGALVQGEFVFFLSTLVQVLDVRCAAHGGLDVTIRGEGRVRISRLKQLNPFITGEVWPVLDMVPREVLQSAQQPTSPWAPWPEQATAEQVPEVARLEQTVRAAEPAPAQQAEGMGAELGGSEEGQRAAAGAEMGWALRAMVQELREVTRDVQGLMVKLDRDEAAAQLSAALQWADDPSPLMCNLGSGSAAAELYCARPGTPSRVGDSHDVGQVSPVLASAVPLPCAVSQLDRATRLSFALLALTQGAGGEGWAGTAAMADPRRAAFCTLDTRERLELVMTSAKSARARLAAQAALRRVRRF